MSTSPSPSSRQVAEGVPYRTRLHHLLECQVHPRVAHDQVAVQVLAVLELHQDGVALRRIEESEG
jgi:hypothetical protein